MWTQNQRGLKLQLSSSREEMNLLNATATHKDTSVVLLSFAAPHMIKAF